MSGRSLLLIVIVLQAACTGASRAPGTTSGATPAPSDLTARVRITQVRVGGPIFTEGSVSYLILKEGEEVVFRQVFRNAPIFRPLIDMKPVQPGSYRVISYQRPCDGSCLALDPPRARCSTALVLGQGDGVVVTIELRLPDRCTMKVEAGAEVGTSYNFKLYTHCGIGPIFFDGRSWIPRGRHARASFNSPPGWGDPFERGSIRLIPDGLLQFTGGSGGSVRFGLPPPDSEVTFSLCY